MRSRSRMTPCAPTPGRPSTSTFDFDSPHGSGASPVRVSSQVRMRSGRMRMMACGTGDHLARRWCGDALPPPGTCGRCASPSRGRTSSGSVISSTIAFQDDPLEAQAALGDVDRHRAAGVRLEIPVLLETESGLHPDALAVPVEPHRRHVRPVRPGWSRCAPGFGSFRKASSRGAVHGRRASSTPSHTVPRFLLTDRARPETWCGSRASRKASPM